MEEKIAFWSTLCYTFLITGMMIGFGLLFQKRPPKNINNLYGYRTRMSMKNEKTWVFYPSICGKDLVLQWDCRLMLFRYHPVLLPPFLPLRNCFGNFDDSAVAPADRCYLADGAGASRTGAGAGAAAGAAGMGVPPTSAASSRSTRAMRPVTLPSRAGSAKRMRHSSASVRRCI